MDITFKGNECAENNIMTSSLSFSGNFFISSEILEPIALISNGCVAHLSIMLIFKSVGNCLQNKTHKIHNPNFFFSPYFF